MNYGFVIDNSRCIGCHACSTACKSENQVPLGVNRTWVKVVESGRYPDVRRSFQVTRCNHCANPPCVRICPTGAMHQRDDGIVDFDGDACIGCKGCTQACPYDAIYIDPDSHTAAKCNYCVHRVDVGLEPACVVVCPEHAILAGDLDDPSTEIARKLAGNNTTVRRPEQGTSPKLFYVQGNELALHPDAGLRPSTYMFADQTQPRRHAASAPQATFVDARGTTRRRPASQGLPPGGPISVGGRMAEHMVQVAFNGQHEIQWHWQIPAYLITKHIAGGLAMLLALAVLSPFAPYDPLAGLVGGALILVMTAITLALLIHDLDRPDRFFYLLVRPQWRSWIARAAWILAAFSGVMGLWWGVELAAWQSLLGAESAELLRWILAVPALPLGLLAAIYTAFLFGQAEGRDMWQGGHLPAQMTSQAGILGAGSLVLLGALLPLEPLLVERAGLVYAISLVLGLALTLVGDSISPHPSEAARRAARSLTRGRWRPHFLTGLLLGHLLPLALFLAGGGWVAAAGVPLAALGLFAYAYAFVMAPQELPNS